MQEYATIKHNGQFIRYIQVNFKYICLLSLLRMAFSCFRKITLQMNNQQMDISLSPEHNWNTVSAFEISSTNMLLQKLLLCVFVALMHLRGHCCNSNTRWNQPLLDFFTRILHLICWLHDCCITSTKVLILTIRLCYRSVIQQLWWLHSTWESFLLNSPNYYSKIYKNCCILITVTNI